MNTVPTTGFPVMLRKALGELDPFLLVAHLARLGAASPPWISQRGLTKALLLAEVSPTADAIGPLPDEVREGALHWRLYVAVLGHPAPLAVEELAPELERLPLALIDDLIDGGFLGADDQPWQHRRDSLEGSYLRARLVPETVTSEEAAELGWPEAVARHTYLAGADETGDTVLDMLIDLHRGDRSRLFDLRAALPNRQRGLLQTIIEGAQVGRWPNAVTADRGLWRLLAAQWGASISSNATRAKPIDPNQGAFHSWRAFCAAYDRILAGDIDGAVRQAALFQSTDITGGRLGAEINNVRAYLAMRPARNRREDLDAAEEILEGIVDAHPQVKLNLVLVHERKHIRLNDRESWENPYFVLGLPHGDPDWTPRWRELSRRHRDDVDALARVNRAWQRIRDAGQATGFFRVPLDDDVLDAPPQRSSALVPPLPALSRRTTTTADDLDFVKALAAPDLLNEFDDTARGDHDRQ
ncbi:hypothetical protein GCM10022254_16620 [Actinomadura meridiana]|uniref:Zorya protein ZorC EH domain-containing protein n=1 Tax=Actinomadura meridiana TaxID=559626 RepID=A0ABP8BVS0_9ACTN